VTHKLKRLVRFLLGLSSRQVAGLLVMAVICAGIAVAAVLDQAAVATSLLALLLACTLGGVLVLARRLGRMHRATQDAVRDLRVVVEQLQRRVLASVEKERLAAGDRHQELTEALARTERLTGRGAELLLREQSREIEALVQLFQHLSPRAPMPSGGPLNPTDLLGLTHLARTRRPGLTVALGSGPSTVWLGYALENSRLVAVDHDLARVEGTRAMLRAHGLTTVEVLHAPVSELTVEGRPVDWYDVDALASLHDIDLLVVDGTIAPSPSDALTPALHVLGRRLAADAAVVTDEAPALEQRSAPRQGGFPLAAQRRVAGRWTTLAYPTAAVPVSS
jgi:predicted O-methyltransferase YrrM